MQLTASSLSLVLCRMVLVPLLVAAAPVAGVDQPAVQPVLPVGEAGLSPLADSALSHFEGTGRLSGNARGVTSGSVGVPQLGGKALLIPGSDRVAEAALACVKVALEKSHVTTGQEVCTD